jgi:hypothetical protein
VEYPEDYSHERFYGITPGKRYVSMGYQGRSPWLVSSLARVRVQPVQLMLPASDRITAHSGCGINVLAAG